MRWGMVHGRFQPFHEGHLAYVEAALATDVDALIVGITNPAGAEPAHATDGHRHAREANPWSYVERAAMILRTLAPLTDKPVVPMPFPLDEPERWGLVPRGTVQIVNVLEPWDVEKVERFRSYGFAIREVQLPRLTSGTEVRRRLAATESYDELVSPQVAELLRRLS